jgi:hypothetical protein
MYPPERIVCLTEETEETLYLLGEDRRIVGVSGYWLAFEQVKKRASDLTAGRLRHFLSRYSVYIAITRDLGANRRVRVRTDIATADIVDIVRRVGAVPLLGCLRLDWLRGERTISGVVAVLLLGRQ